MMLSGKRLWLLVLVMACVILSMGMSGKGNGPRRIPTPVKNFSATIISPPSSIAGARMSHVCNLLQLLPLSWIHDKIYHKLF